MDFKYPDNWKEISEQVRARAGYKCQKCGKYSVECPYCHQNSVTTQLPDIIQCPHCGKVYQVRLFEL